MASMKKLTRREEEIMRYFWQKGPLFVRELRALYPDPKPHFNTLSTFVRNLEAEGFLNHNDYGPTYQYYAIVTEDEYKKQSLSNIIDKYFGNSYMNVVSAFVDENKISVDELKELVAKVESLKRK